MSKIKSKKLGHWLTGLLVTGLLITGLLVTGLHGQIQEIRKGSGGGPSTGGSGSASNAVVSGNNLGTTNAQRIGVFYRVDANTNMEFRTISAGNGLIKTNEGGTNISTAIDPAVVASQANLTGTSNALVTLSANNHTNANVVYLRADGNDATAVRGNSKFAAATFSNALSMVQSGDTLDMGGATYPVRGHLFNDYNNIPLLDCLLSGKSNITFRGRGGVVLHATNDGMAFCYFNGRNLHFDGITFRGTLTNSTAYTFGGNLPWALVQGYGTNDNVTFKNCSWENANVFGLKSGYVTGDARQSLTRNLNVSDFRFTRCGFTNMPDAGGLIDGGAADLHGDGVFDRGLVERCGRGIEFYSDGTGFPDSHAIVRNTRFLNNWARNVFFFGGRTVAGARVDTCSFAVDHAARQLNADVIAFRFVTDLIISKCTITNLPSGNVAIRGDMQGFGEARNVQILDNYISNVDFAYAGAYLDGLKFSGNIMEYVTNSTALLHGRDMVAEFNYFRDCNMGGSGYYLWLQGGPPFATNNIARMNTFSRTIAGAGAPAAFLRIDAGQHEAKVEHNVFSDRLGTIPWISDAGTNTRVFNPVRSRWDTNDHLWMAGNIYPNLDETRNLGSDGAAWLDVWTHNVRFSDDDSAFTFTLFQPDQLPASIGWILPNTNAVAGQLLTSDGAAGNLSWSGPYASQANLTTASNTLNSALVANDTTTSNALRTIVGQAGTNKVNDLNGAATNLNLYGPLTYNRTVLPATWHFDGATNGIVRTNISGAGPYGLILTNLQADGIYRFEFDASLNVVAGTELFITGFTNLPPVSSNRLTVITIERIGTTTNITYEVQDAIHQVAHATALNFDGRADSKTDVTNVVSAAAIYTITKPKIGESGSVTLRDNGTTRTIQVQAWPAAIVLLATNNFSFNTNLHTVANSIMHLNWDCRAGTNGTTNVIMWAVVEGGMNLPVTIDFVNAYAVTNSATSITVTGNRSAMETVSASGSNVTIVVNGKHKMIGSSNINIVAIMGYTSGGTVCDFVTFSVTNLSGINWGFSFPSTTNAVRWVGAPVTSLPAGSHTEFAARLQGTNVFIAGATNLNPVTASW